MKDQNQLCQERMDIGAPRIAVLNLGCKVNRYETDAVLQQFLDAGYQPAGFQEEADVYVLNTCAVTGEAARKSGQMLRRARKQNPHSVLVVMGCHIQLGGDWAEADIAVGNQGKSRVFAAVEHFRRDWLDRGGRLEDRPAAVDLTQTMPLTESVDFEDFGSVSHQTETRAYLKIQDGCNNFCSYCAIPYARGRVRSRSEASILEEAVDLAAQGFQELVLTGIHVCSYGKDRGEPSTALVDLCAKIAQIPGVQRLRLGSLEPLSVTEEFVRKAAANPKLCPHFHLSLQSGSDATLQRMRRRYSAEQFRQVVRALRRAYGSRLGLTTDVIVGFPGETEDEFAESVAFCREMSFTRMHVFRYSQRAGTAAVSLPDPVSASVSADRARILGRLASQLQEEHAQSRMGQEEQILLEQLDEDGCYTGYAPNYDPLVLEEAIGEEHGKPGAILTGTIVGQRGDRLVLRLS